MRKTDLTSGKTLALMSFSISAVLWTIWFLAYRHYLIWLEGISYFSTLPDFFAQHKDMQYGLLAYIGSFLHQFYACPAVGAAVQTFMATWLVICTGIIIIRFFKNSKQAMWMSLIPVPFFVCFQFWDLRMLNSVLWFLIFTGALLVVPVVPAVLKRKWTMPEFLCWKPLNIIILILTASVSAYMLLYMDPRNKVHEDQVSLQYLGENHKWDEILYTVSVADARTDDLKRKYVLLALSEKGLLKDNAFKYGLTSSEDFIFFESINPLCLNYNALFYQCNGIHNAAIHQLYQQGVQSHFGVSFSTLRRLADIYIELKDYTIAKKYVDILDHSTCNGKWVRERLGKLESIRDAEPAYVVDTEKATITAFTQTITSMLQMYPDNQKYAEILLCCLLADGVITADDLKK